MPKAFDPRKSKYGLERREKNAELREARQDSSPAYLLDEEKYREHVSKDYELVNPEDLKE